MVGDGRSGYETLVGQLKDLSSVLQTKVMEKLLLDRAIMLLPRPTARCTPCQPFDLAPVMQTLAQALSTAPADLNMMILTAEFWIADTWDLFGT